MGSIFEQLRDSAGAFARGTAPPEIGLSLKRGFHRWVGKQVGRQFLGLLDKIEGLVQGLSTTDLEILVDDETDSEDEDGGGAAAGNGAKVDTERLLAEIQQLSATLLSYLRKKDPAGELCLVSRWAWIQSARASGDAAALELAADVVREMARQLKKSAVSEAFALYIQVGYTHAIYMMCLTGGGCVRYGDAGAATAARLSILPGTVGRPVWLPDRWRLDG